MSYHIKELVLSKTKFANYNISEVESSYKELKDLSKINIFVGENNSGKSRFMREIVSINQYNFRTDDIEKINEIIYKFKEDVSSVLNNTSDYSSKVIEKVKSDYNQINVLDFLKSSRSHLEKIYTLADNIDRGLETVNKRLSPSSSITHGNDRTDKPILEKLKIITEQIKSEIDNVNSIKKYEFKKIYIPTLRGLRPFDDKKAEVTDIYKKRTINDYWNDIGNLDVEVFTGLTMYQDVKRLLLGNLEDREKISEFQQFLSETFFNGQGVALIPKIDDDVLHIKVGDEKEYPIYELGDGIQSIIVLIFPLFIKQGENLLVFIEEPEIYLHPGLQRTFIETLMREEFNNFQCFITTHSNHFLDITLDEEQISIYKFSKELDDSNSKQKVANFTVENVSNEDDSVLGLLGVRNSSVFLSNCTIWVEGITDRYYLRKYLEIYQEKMKEEGKKVFKEDLHYSFVEYAGNNITHWSFLDEEEEPMNVDRLCGKIFLIVDNDEAREGSKKAERHKKLEEFLGSCFCKLECREIENLLSKRVLLETIREYEGNEFNPNEDFNEADYRGQYLGRFIAETILNGNQNRRGEYKTDSGTITGKLKFCKRAIRNISSIDDLSEEAKKLCEDIYSFIAKNNN